MEPYNTCNDSSIQPFTRQFQDLDKYTKTIRQQFADALLSVLHHFVGVTLEDLIHLHSHTCSATIMLAVTTLLNQLFIVIAFDSHFKKLKHLPLIYQQLQKRYKRLFNPQLGEDRCASAMA